MSSDANKRLAERLRKGQGGSDGEDIVAGVRRGDHIRHKEENTTKDKDWVKTPWKVTLGIVKDKIDPRAHEAVYYVRAPNPGQAAYFADRLWHKWEKVHWGIPWKAAYPDTIGEQICEKIPEEEWFSLWRHAQNMRGVGEFEKVGPTSSPDAFAFWPAGRVKPGFYEQFQGTRMEGGIIIPG